MIVRPGQLPHCWVLFFQFSSPSFSVYDKHISTYFIFQLFESITNKMNLSVLSRISSVEMTALHFWWKSLRERQSWLASKYRSMGLPVLHLHSSKLKLQTHSPIHPLLRYTKLCLSSWLSHILSWRNALVPCHLYQTVSFSWCDKEIFVSFG